ncbi:MAG: 50S ribosomal protein L24 [Bacteroidales bacterium]|nr:50S ribosomal protein L24 [Bacteroidales bacterium]
MRVKLKIKKGDIVKVICGNSKGQQGKVLQILIKQNRAVVEGINIVTKHSRPSAKNSKGGIIKKEASIHISNLMVVDGSGSATRVGRRIENEKIIRYSKKSGEVIK